MSSLLCIQLLGQFQIIYGGSILSDFQQSLRLQALLAYLVINDEIPQPRAHIANLFWPASSPGQALTNLRKLIYQLRRLLPDEGHYLIQDNQSIQWNSQSNYELDVLKMWQLLGKVKQDPFNLGFLTEVTNQYSGKFLPPINDGWTSPIRNALHEGVEQVLMRLIRLFEYREKYDKGIYYAQKLVDLDPLDENNYRQLMRLQRLSGDRTAALETYQRCASILRRELNLEPTVEIQNMYNDLLSTANFFGHQLPPVASTEKRIPLVGRKSELNNMQLILKRVMNGRSYCLLIAGESGIGKTRLSEELLDFASKQGIVVARSRAYDIQGDLALAGVAQLLGTPEIVNRLKKIGNVWLNEVIRLIPELLDEYPDMSLETTDTISENRQRRLFFEGVARAILADNEPIILFLDDMQWLDLETLECLYYLLRNRPDACLLIMGTYRDNEVEMNHPLDKFRRNLLRQDLITQLSLAAFNQVDTGSLAALVAERDISTSQQKTLYQNTEGNPFFIVEMMRAQ